MRGCGGPGGRRGTCTRECTRACACARAQMLRRCGRARTSGWAKRRALPCGLCVRCRDSARPLLWAESRALPPERQHSRRLPLRPHAGPPDRRASGDGAGEQRRQAMRMEQMTKAGGRPAAGARRWRRWRWRRLEQRRWRRWRRSVAGDSDGSVGGGGAVGGGAISRRASLSGPSPSAAAAGGKAPPPAGAPRLRVASLVPTAAGGGSVLPAARPWMPAGTGSVILRRRQDDAARALGGEAGPFSLAPW